MDVLSLCCRYCGVGTTDFTDFVLFFHGLLCLCASLSIALGWALPIHDLLFRCFVFQPLERRLRFMSTI